MPAPDRLNRALRRIAPPADGTDADLLARFAAARDEAAFAALVARHGPMVLAVCRRVLDCPHAAEDACQATFLVLARRAPALRVRQSVAAWLHGVARRAALAAHRAAARRRRHEGAVVPREPTSRPLDEFAELRAVIDQEVARLPAKYRSIVVLADLEGRDRKAVAAELGIAEGTVASRHSRARALLAGRLRMRGWGHYAYPAVVAPAVIGPALANQVLTLMNSGRTAGASLVPAELLAREVTSTMTRTKLALAAAGVAAVLIAAGVSADGPKSADPPGYTLHSAGGSTVLLNPATGDTWVLQQPPRGEPAWVPVRRPAPPAAPVPQAKTPPAKSESVAKDGPPPTKAEPEPVLATGRLVLAEQVRIRPRSTGIVTRVLVRQGDEVKPGQTLVELDDTDAKLALERAEAGLVVAEAGLYPDNQIVPEQHRRKAEAEVRRAKVEVKQAQAAVQATQLVSPVAGTAIEVNAGAGDTAGPTGLPAVVVANLKALEASVDVTEADAGRVKVGQLCLVRVAAGGAEYPGMVVRAGSVVDPATGTMVVHVRLKLPEGAKPPPAGAFVSVRFGGPK